MQLTVSSPSGDQPFRSKGTDVAERRMWIITSKPIEIKGAGGDLGNIMGGLKQHGTNTAMLNWVYFPPISFGSVRSGKIYAEG